jgi:AraC-like DNA-binding protein
MSARSLQRRLREEGTTFRNLVDEVRRDLAQDYIGDPGISLMEVAFVLGFSVYSSFSRAYKRWTGMSPGEGRRESLKVEDTISHNEIADM